MEHMKTWMEFLKEHLLSGSVEKVKAVGSHSREAKVDSEKEEKYLNNQGCFQSNI